MNHGGPFAVAAITVFVSGCAEASSQPARPEVFEDAGGNGGARADSGSPPSAGCVDDGDCTTNQACESAVCVELICTPNAVECSTDGRDVIRCSGKGTARTVVASCTADQICDQSVCRTTVCTPGAARCRGSAVVRCGALGLDEDTVVQSCAPTEFCDTASASCRPNECTRGELRCDGDRLVRCGTGPADTAVIDDCSQSSGVCENADCVPVVCLPGSERCDEDVRRRCAGRGTFEESLPACAADEHCSEANGSATCEKDVCPKNDLYCVGQVATVCNATGTGPKETYQNCLTDWHPGRACVEGECLSVVCTPGAQTCARSHEGPSRQGTCNASGTDLDSPTPCGDPVWGCADVDGETICVEGRCNARACSGERYTCAGVDTACTAPNVCSASPGGCAPFALDANPAVGTQGTEGNYFSGPGILTGNFYVADTDRSLVEIEEFLLGGLTRDITWLVYEGTSPTLTKILEKPVHYDRDLGGVMSSGPVAVHLEAGRTYYVATYFPDLVGVMIGSAPSPARVSFGNRVSWYTNQGLASPPPTVAYPISGLNRWPSQRLKTAP